MMLLARANYIDRYHFTSRVFSRQRTGEFRATSHLRKVSLSEITSREIFYAIIITSELNRLLATGTHLGSFFGKFPSLVNVFSYSSSLKH